MPYKRYDIKNKYNYRGRRSNDPVVFKTILLIVMPLVIIGIVLLGIFISYKIAVKKPQVEIIPAATADEVELVPEEELLRLVNDSNPLDPDFVPELSEYGGVQISVYMADALEKMINDAGKDGVVITVSQGYISYDEQGELFEKTLKEFEKDNSKVTAEAETKKIVPEAGHSEAQTGLLVKLSTDEESFEGSEAQLWLEKNSVSYGFILRYSEDSSNSKGMAYNPQLYRYVGEEHALNVRKYGMTLDEYFTHISMQ